MLEKLRRAFIREKDNTAIITKQSNKLDSPILTAKQKADCKIIERELKHMRYDIRRTIKREFETKRDLGISLHVPRYTDHKTPERTYLEEQRDPRYVHHIDNRIRNMSDSQKEELNVELNWANYAELKAKGQPENWTKQNISTAVSIKTAIKNTPINIHNFKSFDVYDPNPKKKR